MNQQIISINLLANSRKSFRTKIGATFLLVGLASLGTWLKACPEVLAQSADSPSDSSMLPSIPADIPSGFPNNSPDPSGDLGAFGTTSIAPGAFGPTSIYTPPGQVVPAPMPPIGDGDSPPAVTSGYGAPTPPSWIGPPKVGFPADMPYSPSMTFPYGTLGQLLTPYVPGPSSVPGNAPDYMPKVYDGLPSAAAVVTLTGSVAPNSMPVVLPDQAPKSRRGGQTTKNFGLKRTQGSLITDFGQPLVNLYKGDLQESKDGPRTILRWQAYNSKQMSPVPYTVQGQLSQSTTDRYGLHKLSNITGDPFVYTYAPY